MSRDETDNGFRGLGVRGKDGYARAVVDGDWISSLAHRLRLRVDAHFRRCAEQCEQTLKNIRIGARATGASLETWCAFTTSCRMVGTSKRVGQPCESTSVPFAPRRPCSFRLVDPRMKIEIESPRRPRQVRRQSSVRGSQPDACPSSSASRVAMPLHRAKNRRSRRSPFGARRCRFGENHSPCCTPHRKSTWAGVRRRAWPPRARRRDRADRPYQRLYASTTMPFFLQNARVSRCCRNG